MTDPTYDPAEVPAWHVLGDQIRREDTLAPGNGGLQTVVRVPYQIDSGPAKGHTAFVDLAPDDYTEAGVEEAITGEVTNTHRIASLGRSRAENGA